ncbi:MAG: two-component system sensor histidine kinase NtrB [Actinomycetota bacterium]
MARYPGEGTEEKRGGGRNLLLIRSGITFALLASVVSMQTRSPELLLTGGFQLLYIAVLLSYGWLLLRFAAWGSVDLPTYAVFLQAGADVAFISILVFATGLYDSVFSFIFVVVILLGSLERYFRGAVGWAILSSAAYTVLVYLEMRGILIPPGYEGTSISFSQFARSAVTNSTAFLLTGVLSGILGEEIRKGKEKVRDRDDQILKLESFHKHVIDNIPSGLLTIDMQGKVNLVNDTACSILGVTREETVGKPMEQVLSGVVGWEAREGRDDSRVPRAEIRFLRADGTELFLGFSTSPMKDAEGHPIGRVVIFQDLTPIRQMEERVKIADRLAGVGELAAGLAHEIRNPLASITGSSQMLRESAAPSGESATLLDIIGRESRRLNGLITDFLAYTGPSQRNTIRLDVAALLRDVAAAVRAGEAREKGVAVDLAPLDALLVEGDGEQLKQVVWNLVRNGVQAAPGGGKVVIDGFEQIRHGVRYVVAMVVDNGVGIAPGVLEKIFNPFFTTKEGGTGLGLSISQRIVHQHKGFIEVRSTPGKGCAFSVFLPAASEGNGVENGDG